MDNAGIHNHDFVKEYFFSRKIMCLTLPQYTPWFNPIESAFNTLKDQVKRNAHETK